MPDTQQMFYIFAIIILLQRHTGNNRPYKKSRALVTNGTYMTDCAA